MKNFGRLIIILALVAVGGHGALWYTASSKAEKAIHDNLKNLNKQAKVSYELEQFGYPFKLGFHVKSLDLKTTSVHEGQVAEYTAQGDMTVHASIFDAEYYNANVSNFTIEATSQEDKTFKILIEDGSAKGKWSKKFADSSNFKNVSVALATPEMTKTIASVESLSTFEENKPAKPGTFNRTINISANNITFNNPDQEGAEPILVDHFVMNARSVNMPNENSLQQAVEAATTEVEATGSASSDNIKLALTEYISDMAKQASEIHIDEISLKNEKMSFKTTANFNVTAEASLSGNLNVHMTGIQHIPEFNAEQIQNNPVAGQFITPEGEFNMNIKVENNMIHLNEQPLFPMPPLMYAVQMIPETLQLKDTL